MTLTIPIGTETRRLRFLFDTKSGATPSSGIEDYWDGDINWVTPEDLGKLTDRYVRETRRRITEEGYKSCGVDLAPPGSIVLSKRAPIGQTAILAVPSTCNQGCFLLTKLDGVDERFYFYSLIHLRPALEALGRGSTFMELSADDLRSILLPFPSEERQRLIADYLDRETARIDALIAEKERMLALLEEKRAALISRVVTRGLDPNAPLKPSGLDWLGEIPAHWGMPQLRFVCRSLQIGPFGSQLHADEYVDNGVPVINPAHLKGNKITPDFGISVDEKTAQRLAIHRLEEGDIVFGRRGELGRCGVVESSQVGWLCGTGSLRVRCDRTLVDPRYVALVFSGTLASTQLALESVGSTMDNLNTEVLGHFRIPLPPLEEQKSIVSAVEAGQRKSNALSDSLQVSISLAKERRAALITAAVTGQIPLEEMQP
ncbi:restriction endonuclease subunit S [Allochromatium tepidum]|uniref:restriction endonuclease subunit S n=1 Tax=Allochromatium tepidum TaxID=553982 RepID=UPI001BCCD57C|nr:restriction endonuclease subunit S [Allochromatium tepidum]